MTCIVLSKFSSSYCKRLNPVGNGNDFLAPLVTPKLRYLRQV